MNLLTQEQERFEKERTEAISEMFDNVNEYGIYPTTKLFQRLDDFLLASNQRILNAVCKLIESKKVYPNSVVHILDDILTSLREIK